MSVNYWARLTRHGWKTSIPRPIVSLFVKRRHDSLHSDRLRHGIEFRWAQTYGCIKKKSHIKTFCCTYLYFLEVALRWQESTTSTLKSNEMICSWYVPLLCWSKFMDGSQAFIKSMKVNMIGFVQLNHWLSHFIWKIIIYFHKNNFVWQVRY